MNISTNAARYKGLAAGSKEAIENKLAPISRLLGEEAASAMLEIEIEHAPAEGRSAQPTRVAATLTTSSRRYHAEAVKPSPESATDRVRATLEAEIKHIRGKHGYLRRKGTAFKNYLRFGS